MSTVQRTTVPSPVHVHCLSLCLSLSLSLCLSLSLSVPLCVYMLHVLVGAGSWLEAGADIVGGIIAKCTVNSKGGSGSGPTGCGYAAVGDVQHGLQWDMMPSFFLAETLKYRLRTKSTAWTHSSFTYTLCIYITVRGQVPLPAVRGRGALAAC